MALTLLQYVNDVLIDAGVIRTDLSALTSNAQQEDVNGAVAAINESIDDLTALDSWPSVISEGTLTLVTDQREYTVASDFVKVADDKSGKPIMTDTTNGATLFPYPGGFDAMRRDQTIPSQHTGLPKFWVISPTSGKFRLNTSPTSSENGNAYTYLYEEETRFVTGSPSATFPITDEALMQLIPAVKEVFNRDKRGKFNDVAHQKSLARTAGKITQVPRKRRWGPHASQQGRRRGTLVS